MNKVSNESLKSTKTYSSCLNNTIPVSSSLIKLLCGNLFLYSWTSGLS